jgi:hypothetical protein
MTNKSLKFVVDVHGDYFTTKVNESDAKIDGFYYFFDCTLVDGLISVLEKYKVIVLHFTNRISSIFKYDKYNDNMIAGTCLSSSFPCSFHHSSIKEVWAIVDGKYIKVWEKEEHSQDVLNACEKVNNTLGGLNKAFEKVFPKVPSIDEQQYNLIKENFKNISDLEVLLRNYVSTPGVVGQFMNRLSAIKDNDYSLLNLNAFKSSWEKIKEKIMPSFTGFKEHSKFQVLIRRFVEICILITVCPIQKEITEKILEQVNKVMTEDGRQEYNKHFKSEPSKQPIDIEKVKEDTIIETLKNNKHVTIKTRNKVWENFIFNSIEGRFVLGDCSGTPTAINLNNIDTVEPSKQQKNIKYRGKPKTVEIMNEFTHPNGKEYVMIKDVTDNGKTKTLFKEYIEWL